MQKFPFVAETPNSIKLLFVAPCIYVVTVASVH